MINNIKFSLLAIEAKDLFASDSNGFSDPYFKIPHKQNGVVDIPGKKNRSQTIKKNLNPVWNHNFDVEFNPQKCNQLKIEVYDYDTFGSDDLIGSGVINLDWMRSGGQDIFEGWIPLYIKIKDKNSKVEQNTQKGSVHVKLQVKYRPTNMSVGPMHTNAPTVQQMIQHPLNQSMPPQKSQNVPMQMSQPPINVPNIYPNLSNNPQQPPMGQPIMGQQPIGQPPMGQPPMNQPPMGQPSMGQPPTGQPPMNQPPNQPPMGQPPNQPPIGQPSMGQPPFGQPPNQPPMGQPPISQPQNQPPIGQPPIGQQPIEQNPNQPPITQPPIGQPPNQPPIGQPPMAQPPNQPPNQPPMEQPPTGQPQYQPPMAQPPNQPPTQPPMAQPPAQPPMGQPPNQPANNQPPNQPPYGQPPNQPPMTQPSNQPPYGQPPNQPPNQQPYGQPPNQPPYGQPPNQPSNQPPYGQPPNQPPYGQPPNQPPMGQQPGYQPPYPQSGAQMYNNQMPSQPHMPHGPNPYQQQPGYNSQQSAIPPHYPPPPGYGVPPQYPPTASHGVPPHYPPPPGYGVPPHYPPAPGYGVPPHYPSPPVNTMIPPVQPSVVVAPPIISITPHINGQPFIPGTWIEVVEPSVMVGLGWDFTGRETFDLDASVTGFDYNYNYIESVYFSNKRGMNNSVIHFGDNTTGQGQGDDELIKVGLSRVPQRVYFLAVTINSFKKNSLIRARSAYIRLYTDSYILGKYTLNRTKDCIGLLLGVFERNPTKGTWYFRVMADPISGNKVTLSINDIKALLGGYSTRNMGAVTRRIVHPLPGEPLIEFNKWIQLPNRFTYIGLGWNIQQGFNYDLDASIITFDRMNNLLEIIFHKNMDSFNHSIIHYGDNRSGFGEGDDEVLSIDFGHVDPNTFTMVVVINSFKGNSMSQVYDAFIRLYDNTHPLGVTLLNNAPDCIGLCFGIFRKHTVSGLWYFCAVKEIVQGIEAPQSVRDVIYILSKYPLKA